MSVINNSSAFNFKNWNNLYNNNWFGTNDNGKIFSIIDKIVKGGKSQLILSLGSDDELEQEVSEYLIKVVAMWRKDKDGE